MFEAETPVLTYTYSFGPGTANALAVGTPTGLVVVSPPWRTPPSAFEDLERYGRVRALVASNAFHHMGMAEWKRRYPDAQTFAPTQSIERVQKKTGLAGILPLRDASGLQGPRLRLIDLPHYRTGEVLVRMETARGLAWYVTDVILNMPELPEQPVVRLLFRLAANAPGLKFNNIAPLFMVKDKAALKRWLAAEVARAPPRWLIATHGDIAELDSRGETLLRLLAPR